ncbi:DUF3667 domain-containing protein [Rhizorhabdus argentea]|uniref:DUF3667 domain-containing protein n=1 Tax=Rhizorhabdus argentea TaxID=1387174 RepID=UPI0030EDB752
MSGELEAVADGATGAMAAGAIDGAGTSVQGAAGGTCLNCGTALVGPHCHSCGQPAHIHRTVGALFHDIAHGVFHFEGRTWHTIPLLFWRPGELTRRYVHGERVNFVSPMALFLFSVFLMVAVFGLVGGPIDSKLNGKDAIALAEARTETANDLSKIEQKIAALIKQKQALEAKGTPTRQIDERIRDLRSQQAALRLITTGQIKRDGVAIDDGQAITGVPSVDNVIRHAARNPELTAYKLQSSAYKFSWALIPISLPFIWLLFMFRRGVGMYDHAIFATYSLSAMTLLVVVLSLAEAVGVPTALVWLTLLLFPPWHMYRQLKGAYQLGWFGASWRMIALIVVAYTSALIFFMLLVAMGL